MKFPIPIAAIVPSIVAIIEEIKATIIVLTNDCNISSFENNLLYHSKVNPVQIPLPLALLKEKKIRTAIGTYKNKNIKAM